MKAHSAAVTGSAGAAGTMVGMGIATAWPTSNIAGYVVAGKILGGGAQTTALVSAVGGPLVAGVIGAVLVGLAAVVGCSIGSRSSPLVQKIMVTKK